MSFLPFGISPTKARSAKGTKASSLPAFAEPTDVPEANDLTDEEKSIKAARLQEEGAAKAEAGEYSAAVRLWDEALALFPVRAVLHELKAQVFLEVDHHWEAICSASQATKLDPSWPEGFLTLARAELSFGEPETALSHMDKVLSLQPGHPEASKEIDTIRMIVLQRRKDPESAKQRLNVV